MKVLWGGHLARPDLGGQDAHPTRDQEFQKKAAHRVKLSRQEIEAMLGLNLQETRFYQEAKAEGEQIGEQRERSLILRQQAIAIAKSPNLLFAPV